MEFDDEQEETPGPSKRQEWLTWQIIEKKKILFQAIIL
jgi:hypothetical protein